MRYIFVGVLLMGAVFAPLCAQDQSAKPDADPQRIGSGVTPPRPIQQPSPDNPKRKAGLMRFSVVVGTDGKVYDIEVLKSIDPITDAAAMKAVKLWRFIPAKKNGQPVAVKIEVEVEFHI